MKRHPEWGAYAGPGDSDSNYGGHPKEYYRKANWPVLALQAVAVVLVLAYAWFFAPSGL